jgi:hypothetical protein
MDPPADPRRRLIRPAVSVAVTLAAAALVFALVPPSDTSSGTVFVMPPARPTNKPTNPLLALDSNLGTVTLILIQSLSNPPQGSLTRSTPPERHTRGHERERRPIPRSGLTAVLAGTQQTVGPPAHSGAHAPDALIIEVADAPP